MAKTQISCLRHFREDSIKKTEMMGVMKRWIEKEEGRKETKNNQEHETNY